MTTRDELLELLMEMSHRHEKRGDEIEYKDYEGLGITKTTARRHLADFVEIGLLTVRQVEHGSSSHKYFSLNPDYKGEVPERFANLFSENGRKPPPKPK